MPDRTMWLPVEAEVRYRMTPGACCSDVPALTGVIGGGVAFF